MIVAVKFLAWMHRLFDIDGIAETTAQPSVITVRVWLIIEKFSADCS